MLEGHCCRLVEASDPILHSFTFRLRKRSALFTVSSQSRVEGTETCVATSATQ